tara:strand:+ start:939 stop:1808 length:870 start_codon:yes stop_codon:yes gene_type:complete
MTLLNKNAYFFLLPAIIYLAIWLFFPLLNNTYLSLLNAETARSRDYFFVGLDNYAELMKDKIFWRALLHNIIWVILSIFFPLVIGLILAAILYNMRSRLFYASIFFIPHTFALIITAIVWRWMYHPKYGLINQTLDNLGLGFFKMHWLGNENTALVAVNMMGSWSYYGFCVLIFLAGLQNIDPTLNDAAKIDGAGPIQRFFKITVPLLKNTFMFLVIWTIIGSMRFFDLIFVATNGTPNLATDITGLYIYRLIMQQGRVTYAGTISVILTLFILSMSFFVIKNLMKEND